MPRMPAQCEDDGRDDVARRQRLSRLGIILICAVGGLLGLLLAGSLRTPAVGEATILLRPLPGNAFAGRGGNTTVDLHTETAIPRSDEVLQRVSQADGNRVRPEELRPRLKVRVIEPTEVLALSFRAPNAARAKALAEDVARATLAVRRERAVAEYARQSAILDPLIVAAEADLANVSAQPDNTDEVLALSDKLVTLRDQLNPVDQRPNPGEVLETSVAKDQDVPRLQAGIVGLGLLGGAGVGWLLSRRWPRGPSAGPSSMRRRFRPATRPPEAGLGSLRTSQRRLAG